jgi:hypothetical protein
MWIGRGNDEFVIAFARYDEKLIVVEREIEGIMSKNTEAFQNELPVRHLRSGWKGT